MSHRYRENRIAYVNTTRRVALDPLLFQGIAVTQLEEPEDYIRYTVYNSNGTVLQATRNAEYDLIYTSERGGQLEAWSGMVEVGEEVQQITIIWEISIFAARETLYDYIDVIDQAVV